MCENYQIYEDLPNNVGQYISYLQKVPYMQLFCKYPSAQYSDMHYGFKQGSQKYLLLQKASKTIKIPNM